MPLEVVRLVIGIIHHTNRELSLEDKKHPLLPQWRKIIYCLNCMKEYQVHPQVNGGLRTFNPVETAIGGGIEASYWKGYDTRGYRPYILVIYGT
nr:MAG TPA: hypothetical protein [Caudoviricetes sp.]